MAMLAGPFVTDKDAVLEVPPDPERVKAIKVGVKLSVVFGNRKARTESVKKIRRGGEDQITAARSPPDGCEPGDGYCGRVTLHGRMPKIGCFQFTLLLG